MPHNTKLEPQQTLLLKNKKGLEIRLEENEIELAENEELLSWSRNDKRHSLICLLISILLTSTIIFFSISNFSIFFASLLNDIKNSTVNPLFVVAFVLHIINFVLICISQKRFNVILILFTIPPFYIAAPIIELLLLFKEVFLTSAIMRQAKTEVDTIQNNINEIKSEIDEIDCKIHQIAVKSGEIHSIYLKAIENNDEKSIILAAKQGDVEAKRYLAKKQELLNLAEAEELYKQAISTNPANEELMKKAAKLGDTSACIYFGRKVFTDIDSTTLTKAEKEHNIVTASKFLEKVKDHDIEAEFLWLAMRVQNESNSATEWQTVLNRIREINNSGELPEMYKDSVTTIIESLVKVIDTIESQDSTNKKMVKSTFYKML